MSKATKAGKTSKATPAKISNQDLDEFETPSPEMKQLNTELRGVKQKIKAKHSPKVAQSPKVTRPAQLPKVAQSPKVTRPASKLGKSPSSRSPMTKHMPSRSPVKQSPAMSVTSVVSDMPGLESIPEEPGHMRINKYLYTPLIETKTIYVHPDARITSEVMTDFEYNHIVGIRAQQLANDLKSFTEIGDLSDPIEIAKLEIANKRCPLSIKRVRTMLNGCEIAELWEVNEMSIP